MADDPDTVSNESEAVAEFRSLDGLRLSATWTVPSAAASSAAVLVHGGGVTRDEGGFFSRLAAGLRQAGIASLRLDLRGHGSSEGRQEDLTLAGIMNDIRAAVAHVRDLTGNGPVNLVGTSFGGGISGCFASHHPDQIRRLVLLNPLVNYKKRLPRTPSSPSRVRARTSSRSPPRRGYWKSKARSTASPSTTIRST